jgi:hypothetical protein
MDADLILVALNRKQLTDFVERESELLRLLDEFEVGHFPFVIEAVPPSVRAGRGNSPAFS